MRWSWQLIFQDLFSDLWNIVENVDGCDDGNLDIYIMIHKGIVVALIYSWKVYQLNTIINIIDYGAHVCLHLLTFKQ